MNEELDSQLSAMFDDELPAAECELLARRLSRDGELKSRWGRYAIVGAVIRSERGVRLNAPLAGRVSAVLLAEPALAAPAAAGLRRAGVRWWQPVLATGLAACVAAACVLWLRAQLPGTPLTADAGARSSAPAVTTVVAPAATAATAPAVSYVVPASSRKPVPLVPTTELANYVVAHSMFSSPVGRRNLLSAFMTSEPAAAAVEELPDAKSGVQ
jgi:sigma-E factor negative regulatory protein RseA